MRLHFPTALLFIKCIKKGHYENIRYNSVVLMLNGYSVNTLNLGYYEKAR